MTIPRQLVLDQAAEEEEKESYQQHFQRPPILDERHVSITSRLETSSALIELTDATELAARLVARINVESDCVVGDGLDDLIDPICDVAQENRWVAGISTKDHGSVVTKEILARRWGIGLDTALRALVATTQVGVRKVLHPVERRYRTRQSHLHFPNLNTRLYTDTMFASAKSLRGNKCAQIFTNGVGYDLFYPLKKESLASEALNEVIRTVGVPKELVSDGARAEVHGKFGAVAKEYCIKQRLTEPYSGWQNRAEAAIREIKRGVRKGDATR